MSYSSAHETSDLRTYAFKEGARGFGGRVALLRCLRPQALPDPSGQRSGRTPASNSGKPRVWLPDGAQRHPRLQRARPWCLDARLLASQGGPRRLRRGRELVFALREAVSALLGRGRRAGAPPAQRAEQGRSRAEGPLLLWVVSAGNRGELA